MKNVLVTGFDPFGGESVNPSAEIARQLHGEVIDGHRVVGARLPCVFGAAGVELLKQIRATQPALVICLGQAGGRAAIALERVAINVDDAPLADNAGAQPIDRPVVCGGPAAYWSTLPIKVTAAELARQGIPAAISQSAGTFVCNHVFYRLMHALRDQRRVRGGFIHVPFLPEQAGSGPSLPLETMVAAVRCAVAVGLRCGRDGSRCLTPTKG